MVNSPRAMNMDWCGAVANCVLYHPCPCWPCRVIRNGPAWRRPLWLSGPTRAVQSPGRVREAQQARRDRGEALAEAVARVHAAPGAGIRTRVDRVLAAMAAERPDRPPPDEMSVIRAMARGEARESDLAA